MSTVLRIILLSAITMLTAAAAAASPMLKSAASIDISSALSFEEYLATGSEDEADEIMTRLGIISVNDELRSSAEGVGAPLTLIVFGWMPCPDCEVVVPYVEAIKRLNPAMISTSYFDRTDDVKTLALSLAGVYKIPTIFAARPDGTLLGPYYLEYPQNVRSIVDSEGDDERKQAVIDEFRKNRYDENLMRDLSELIRSAEPGAKP
jgi:hypothetical protein